MTTATGAPAASSWRREDLRGAGKDDRAHAERAQQIGAGRGGPDAADEAERNEPEAGGQHFDEARAEVGRIEDAAHEEGSSDVRQLRPSVHCRDT